ncbi:MAG: cation diffusion facilitator family transporter, partial [Flavobacteriaceae bacterium]
NIRSAYVHLFSDLLASVAVLIGAIAISAFNWHIIDPLLSIIISLYLIYLGYDLLKDSIQILMLYTPFELDLKEVIQAVHDFEEVKKLHHIHVWKLNDTEIHLEAHIDVHQNLNLSSFNELQQRIEKMLLDRFKINHITLQPEYNKDDPKAFIVQD